MPFTLHKSERLNDKTIIKELFEKGNRGFTRFPFRVSWVYSVNQRSNSPRVLFVVSKRNFSSAVDRNYIKRQLREAYRVQKNVLEDSDLVNLCIMIAYVGKIKVTSHEMRLGIEKILALLKNELQKTAQASVSPADKGL